MEEVEARAAASDQEWGELEIALTLAENNHRDHFLVFALFSRGRVLAAPRPNTLVEQAPWWVTLSADEKRALLAGLKLDRIGNMRAPLGADVADGVAECIHHWSHGAHHRECVRAGFEGGRPQVSALQTIWDRLTRFTSPRAAPFRAAFVDVRLREVKQPYGYSNAPLHSWPPTWPLPRAMSASQGSDLVGLLPASDAPPRETPMEFLLDGKRYLTNTHRRFPAEHAWREND